MHFWHGFTNDLFVMPIDITIKYAELPNGLTYFYQHWIPQSPPALVVYVHGLGDHIGRYQHLVNRLANDGLAVALYDQRGHGRSEGRRGHVGRFSDWVEDLAGFVQFSASAVPPDTPLFLIGQGLGALVAINYVLTHAVNVGGLVTISAALKPMVRIPGWKRRAGEKVARFLPWLTLEDGVRPSDLTREISEVEAVAGDSLYHTRVSLAAGQEIERYVALLGGVPHRMHEPFLMLAGTGDRISDPQASSWFTARAQSLDKGCKIYDGMYHDLLHDIGWEVVLGDLESWILDRAGLTVPSEQYRLSGRGETWQNISRVRR